jgi:hypothetical protein
MPRCDGCIYAACIDICPDYETKGFTRSGIPRGLRKSNPREYFRLYREKNRTRLTEYQNDYNKINREAMKPKWREQKRKERGRTTA